jgi:hypothetical protein
MYFMINHYALITFKINIFKKPSLRAISSAVERKTANL